MIKVGAQLSAARGFETVIREAGNAGYSTLQVFSRNPVGGQTKGLPERGTIAPILQEAGIRPLFVHAPYFVNPAAIENAMQERARNVLSDEMQRIKHLSGDFLVLHPGHRQSADIGECQEALASTIVHLLRKSGKILLENASGQGKEQGGDFRELREILQRIGGTGRVGVMLDTAHAMAFGYPMQTAEDFENLLEVVEETIGIRRIFGLHLNDNLYDVGSRRDRHEHLLKGFMGEGALQALLENAERYKWPLILETPGRDIASREEDISLILRKMQ